MNIFNHLLYIYFQFLAADFLLTKGKNIRLGSVNVEEVGHCDMDAEQEDKRQLSVATESTK